MENGSKMASNIDPLSDPFGQKGSKWCSPLIEGEHPDADLVATWRRKRSKDAFGSIRDRFLMGSRMILNILWIEFT